MTQAKLKTGAAAIIGGSVFFVGFVLFAVTVAEYNAQASPAIPWFPLPVWGVLFGLVYWINHTCDIGLAWRRDKPWGLIAGFAVLSMIASHCVLVLEGAFHGMTRSFEAAPDGVTPFFAVVYWVGIVVAMSTASETAYRGIMQSKLTPLFGVGAAIAIATFVNTISHRWDGFGERVIGVIAILLAWGYLRHLSGSLMPTILTHIAAIAVWDIILWTWGPWDHSQMTLTSIGATALIGLVSLGAAVYCARAITRQV